MEKIRIREDNKKLFKMIYIIIAAYASVIAYINIMNTKGETDNVIQLDCSRAYLTYEMDENLYIKVYENGMSES